MDDLRRSGGRISVSIKPDEDGFTGRECPQQDCEGYFKIEFGTGLKGENLPCHCPYCGHTAAHDHFWTKEQIEYARSVAVRQLTDAVHKELKKHEFEIKPKGRFGIGFSLKVEKGKPRAIHHYRERDLETEIVCGNCTLRYTVYGVFAFCPDCGVHNSLQILEKNLLVVEKTLNMASGLDQEVAERLIENALEDCVSAFDGFGREICRVYVGEASDSAKVQRLTFQNLELANQSMRSLFNIDLEQCIGTTDWKAAIRGFQKRHVVAHKMGVVDQEYIRKSGDQSVIVGRKLPVTSLEILELIQILAKLAKTVSKKLGQL